MIESADKPRPPVTSLWPSALFLVVLLATPIAAVVGLYAHLVVRAAVWGWGLVG